MNLSASQSALRAVCLEFAHLEALLAFVQHERRQYGEGEVQQQKFLLRSYESACRALEAANSSAMINDAEFTRFADTLRLVESRYLLV
jgi:hypothetical protein